MEGSYFMPDVRMQSWFGFAITSAEALNLGYAITYAVPFYTYSYWCWTGNYANKSLCQDNLGKGPGNEWMTFAKVHGLNYAIGLFLWNDLPYFGFNG